MDEIENLRSDINKIDIKIYKLLKSRKEKAIKIGKVKKNKNLPVIDRIREKQIIDSLDGDFEKQIFKKILSESRKLQL